MTTQTYTVQDCLTGLTVGQLIEHLSYYADATPVILRVDSNNSITVDVNDMSDSPKAEHRVSACSFVRRSDYIGYLSGAVELR